MFSYKKKLTLKSLPREIPNCYHGTRVAYLVLCILQTGHDNGTWHYIDIIIPSIKETDSKRFGIGCNPRKTKAVRSHRSRRSQLSSRPLPSLPPTGIL